MNHSNSVSKLDREEKGKCSFTDKSFNLGVLKTRFHSYSNAQPISEQ